MMRAPLTLFSLILILLLSSPAASAQSTEWTLRVNVEKASVRQGPRPTAAVVTTLAKGTVLSSYERRGDWFRVVFDEGKGGLTSLGYLHSGDVEVLSEKTAKERDFWEEAPEDVPIRGFTVRIDGGLASFTGGDTEEGVRGIWQRKADTLASAGYLLEGELKPFRRAYEISADLIYQLSPRLGIGLGTGYTYGNRQSILAYNRAEEPWFIHQMGLRPTLRILPLRLGLFYSLPINSFLSLSLSAGAGYYRVKYQLKIISGSVDLDGLEIKVSTSGLGFFGSLGLEMKLQRRAFLFLELRGRHARIGGFTGTETQVRCFLNQLGELYDETTQWDGTLYYTENQGRGNLTVSESAPPVPGTVREAVFDFSGFGLAAGLKFTF